MNHNILIPIVIAIFASVELAAVAKEFRLAVQVPLSAAQTAGNTLVLGVPGFVPLKNGKAGSPEHKPEDGAS